MSSLCSRPFYDSRQDILLRIFMLHEYTFPYISLKWALIIRYLGDYHLFTSFRAQISNKHVHRLKFVFVK